LTKEHLLVSSPIKLITSFDFQLRNLYFKFPLPNQIAYKFSGNDDFNKDVEVMLEKIIFNKRNKTEKNLCFWISKSADRISNFKKSNVVKDNFNKEKKHLNC
jgi:hypothetical protein